MRSRGPTGRRRTGWATTVASGTATIVGNAGRLAFTDTANAYARAQLTGLAARADSTSTFSYQWSSTTATAPTSTCTPAARAAGPTATGPRNGYGLELASNSGTITVLRGHQRHRATLRTVAAGQAVTTAEAVAGLRVVGTTIQFKIWLDGQAEPAAWTSTDTDAGVTAAGQLHLSVVRSSTNVGAKDVTIDDLVVSDGASATGVSTVRRRRWAIAAAALVLGVLPFAAPPFATRPAGASDVPATMVARPLASWRTNGEGLATVVVGTTAYLGGDVRHRAQPRRPHRRQPGQPGCVRRAHRRAHHGLPGRHQRRRARPRLRRRAPLRGRVVHVGQRHGPGPPRRRRPHHGRGRGRLVGRRQLERVRPRHRRDQPLRRRIVHRRALGVAVPGRSGEPGDGRRHALRPGAQQQRGVAGRRPRRDRPSTSAGRSPRSTASPARGWSAPTAPGGHGR